MVAALILTGKEAAKMAVIRPLCAQDDFDEVIMISKDTAYITEEVEIVN